jgi:non-specific serine/threonine protein kinase
VRALPVETIDARLSDRFRLLAGGDQTARPRQQTLRALIDWSYDLLTEPEKVLLRRLSVFAGGWTLEAAEAVCTGAGLDKADVLELLTHLVDKSLVAMDAEGSRYRLLETVREYARGKLDASGDGEAVRLRHLDHFVEFAETARGSLSGFDRAFWLNGMDLERENLLVAHAWSANVSGGGERALRLVFALGSYWFIRGQPGLLMRLATETLARPDTQHRTVARCRVLFDVGQQSCFMGRYVQAQPPLEEALAIARELGDDVMSERVLQPLAMAAAWRGDIPSARRHLEEAVALARNIGDKRELAAGLNGLAQLHRVERELDAAEPLYEQAVELFREVGDRESVAIGLLNLAMVSIGREHADRASRMLTEVLDIAIETGSKPVGQSALDVTAGLGASRAELELAARFYGAAQTQIVETGIQRDPTDEAFLQPLVERVRAALGPTAFDRAEGEGRKLSYEQGIDEARAWLSHAS